MSDLTAAMDTAFDEVRSEGSTPAPASEPEAAPSPEPAAEPEEAAQPAEPEPAQPQDEPTGDVLLDKLTPEQIAELKKDPRLKAIYKGLMSSYTPKMQQFAEQARLWDALNDPQTQRQAVEALARAVGVDIQPTDQPQRQQAAQVADEISDEWSKVVGPEAAQMLRPLIEKTALAAVQGTIQPMQKAADFVFQDARARQAEAQVNQFRSLAKEKGWELTPEVEVRMAQLGQQMVPAQPIETVEQGVEFMKRLYVAATADDMEAKIEKRILERMNKAAQTAEPARGVPSAGRSRPSGITKEMNLNEALDVAMQEALAEGRR